MDVKDYHRLVKANYLATEGPRVGSPALQAYLPFVHPACIGLLVGGAVAFGYF